MSSSWVWLWAVALICMAAIVQIGYSTHTRGVSGHPTRANYVSLKFLLIQKVVWICVWIKWTTLVCIIPSLATRPKSYIGANCPETSGTVQVSYVPLFSSEYCPLSVNRGPLLYTRVLPDFSSPSLHRALTVVNKEARPHKALPPNIPKVSFSSNSRANKWKEYYEADAQQLLRGTLFTPTSAGMNFFHRAIRLWVNEALNRAVRRLCKVGQLCVIRWMHARKIFGDHAP